MPTIHVANSVAALRRCYPVMAQLRPHLDEAGFLARVKTQAKEGYRIAYAEKAGRITAVAGYRIQHMLYQQESGRMMYVDDLVTAEKARSLGHGRLLLSWLANEARRTGCDALELDSGVQRVGAHRFYLGQGMHISSYHFRHPLRTPPPRVLFFAAAPSSRRRTS